MSGRERATDEPGGLAFWTGLVLGWAVMAYAVWGIVQEADATNPPGLVRWVIGAALLHDLVFAPLAAGLGLVLARVLPSRVRGPVLVASAMTVLVLAYAYPLLRGFGRRPLNPSALPRDYVTNVVIVVAAIWAVAAVVLVVRVGAVEGVATHGGADVTRAPNRLTAGPLAGTRNAVAALPSVPNVPKVRDPRVDAAVLTVLALAAWGSIVAIGRVWGLYLGLQGRQLVLFTPPILGGYRLETTTTWWLPILAGAALVAALPALAERLRWPALLVATAVGALLWWVALALVDGVGGLTDGLHWDADFGPVIDTISASPGTFLSTFTDLVPTYGIQVRAHPPGLPLLLGALDRVGLEGPGWATAVTLASAASGVVGVLVAVRALAGEQVARRAAPFLVLAPAALWIATSFDALYVGPAAWFVTCFVLAATGAGRRRVVYSVLAGVLGTVTIMLSYGLILMAAPIVLIGIARRAWRPLAITTGVAVATTGLFVPFGFWWLTGLEATRDEYYGLGLDRPFWFFAVNNLAAWALAIGPATAVALARLRDPRLWLLVGGGLAAVVLADLSGLSNGEVERIWLPFTVWVLVASAAIGPTVNAPTVIAAKALAARVWLAVQAGTAITVLALVRPYW